MTYSVIVPAYNCRDMLEATVSSILRGGLTDLELLLVDDGSTDGTGALCDVLAAEHGCIRCIHQSNAGVSAARNRGLEEARGEYILFFDADDSVAEGSLRQAAAAVEAYRPDMLIFGLTFQYYFRDKLYRRDELVPPAEGLLQRAQWQPMMDELYRCNALSPVWNKLIRREMLTEHQIRFRRDLIEMEDFLFSVCCMARCGDIYFLPQAIYGYRQAEDEQSTFRRLLRIPSLTAYMQPFEETVPFVPAEVPTQIHLSLFGEEMRFGGLKEIRRAGRDMLQGRYAAAVQEAQPRLYEHLAQGRYGRVRCRSAMARLRHWLAVRVKYVRSGGRLA